MWFLLKGFVVCFVFLMLFSCSTLPPRHSLKEHMDYVALHRELVEFCREQEAFILQNGRPLTSFERKVAEKIGVQHPEKVRIVRSRVLPKFTGEYLSVWAEKHHFHAQSTAAFTFGYGIIIRKKYSASKPLLAHELTHIRQAEGLGLEVYLSQYIQQLKDIGYFKAPFEQEARVVSENYYRLMFHDI